MLSYRPEAQFCSYNEAKQSTPFFNLVLQEAQAAFKFVKILHLSQVALFGYVGWLAGNIFFRQKELRGKLETVLFLGW